jgi:hypothetical protein
MWSSRAVQERESRRDRVLAEIEPQLRPRFGEVLHGEEFDWVLISRFPLDAAILKESSTKLLFRIPVGYPSTGPDDFFVERSLRMADGAPIPGLNEGSESSSGPAPVAGEWGWFSWHPQSWRPAARIEDGDNLLTFLRGAAACLRGAQET